MSFLSHSKIDVALKSPFYRNSIIVILKVALILK
jgi:hypothetical protein